MRYALIVAGGSGSRMKTETPKQFLCLQGLPVLMHTIIRFYQFDPSLKIVVVLPENQLVFWKSLVKKHRFDVTVTVVPGGNTRYKSVQNGLNAMGENGFVAIHDGVRPMVDLDVIGRSFETAESKGNAVTAVKIKDSIRKIERTGSLRVDRELYVAIQTPQTFNLEHIKAAYLKSEDDLMFTDDASVLEHAGHDINLIEGNYANIKITTPEDLIIAEAILGQNK